MLSVGGLMLGHVDGHERTAELDPADSLLLEFFTPGHRTVRFFFDEAFLLDPPAHVDLYYTRSGVALALSGVPEEDGSLKLIRQERIGGTLLTLYKQGSLQLSLENETGFHLVDLPPSLEGAAFAAAGEGFVVFSDVAFCLLGHDGTVVTISEGTVSETGVRVTAEVPFHDSLRHTALCTYENGKLTDCRIRTGMTPTAATYALALFECALIGADPTPYLHENLLAKAGALREFLGDYTSVVLTQTPEEVGLVYARKPHVYEVRYFRVTLEENGKISNILPLES